MSRKQTVPTTLINDVKASAIVTPALPTEVPFDDTVEIASLLDYQAQYEAATTGKFDHLVILLRDAHRDAYQQWRASIKRVPQGEGNRPQRVVSFLAKRSALLFEAKAIAQHLMERGGVPTLAEMAELADHQVWSQPLTSGRFSKIDLARLIEGGSRSGKASRGLSNLHLAGYATVHPTDAGFVLELEGVEHTLTGYALHMLCRSQLVSSRKAVSEQAVPFTASCVFPRPANGSTLDNQPVFDGISFLVPAGTKVATTSGEIILAQQTRVSMDYTVYRWCLRAILASYAGTALSKDEAAVRDLHVLTQALGGTVRVPANGIELDYCQKLERYQREPEATRERFFQPGFMLAGYAPADMVSLSAFTAARKRIADEKAAAQAEESAAKTTVAVVADDNDDPFLPEI